MKVTILAFDDCTALGPIGPMEILYKTNPIYQDLKNGSYSEPFFDIQLCSAENPIVHTANGYPISCQRTIDQVESCDLVIIPALDEDIVEKIENNRAVLPWLVDQYEKGAELASVCTGAFMIAETGLLDGKSATTHWTATDLFRKRYPEVHLKPQRIIVDEGKICSSGGATSFLNLMIYLIEKFCGKEIAIFASKVFLIDVNKNSQNSYSIFSIQKDHDDKEILFAQNFIENNAERRVSVEEVARSSAISKRNLIRRFKKATGNTPGEYIQRFKVEQVKKSLEGERDSIENMIRNIGYEDIDSFRKVFKKFTGVTPLEYRRRYRIPRTLF